MSAIKPKPTQRERLVGAMIDLCASVGYQNVSVAEVSSRAGVSSATFYEQFDGKEDCLLAAFQTARGRVFRHLEPQDPEQTWEQAARMALQGLFRGLQADPGAGRLLFVEALGGGERMREARELALDEQEQRVEGFLLSRPKGTETLDIPVVALEGARRYIVSRHLRAHSEDLLSSRVDDIVAWMSCYAVPAGKELWSTGPSALLAPTPPQATTNAGDGRPERLPRGRHGLPPSVVARSQRNRIIAGTAEIIAAKGYANATVADIVAAAGVSRDVFYEHFTDKQNAFLEAQQFATQAILNTCAAAYFSASEWPERIWRALHALLKLIAEHPAIAYVRLVESYAVGEVAVRSIEEFVRAATIFLEEGFNYRPENQALPRISTHAISGAVLEVVARHVARGENAELVRQLPQLTYIALAPFMGTEQAIQAVAQSSAAHPALAAE
ncbi:MAG TPA: TetR/AcrR family transcriptional regulator [Solirubrobacteraceae bacterium]|jgi:AcrR family transcriptional regulator|nr:TetR/AcrR family transcriptional regulator [Solirubrobacteraceae bacterium]